MDSGGPGANVVLVLVVVGVVIAVLWILLPFAVFGVKDLLRQVHREQKRTNELLERMAATQSVEPPRPRNNALERLAGGDQT